MCLNVEFARIIKQLRERYDLSQEEMAFKCGMHTEHIGKMERGRITPSFETVLKIANAFSMSMTELLSLNERFLETQQDEDLNPIIIKIEDILKKMSENDQARALIIVQALAK